MGKELSNRHGAIVICIDVPLEVDSLQVVTEINGDMAIPVFVRLPRPPRFMAGVDGCAMILLTVRRARELARSERLQGRGGGSGSWSSLPNHSTFEAKIGGFLADNSLTCDDLMLVSAFGVAI